MELDQQLEVIQQLSEHVHEVFNELKAAQIEYLTLLESHATAKETLARAIDRAYDERKVQGKNEREREANLRRLLPEEHREVLRLEALMRGAERHYIGLQRDGERLTLQVTIAKIINNIYMA